MQRALHRHMAVFRDKDFGQDDFFHVNSMGLKKTTLYTKRQYNAKHYQKNIVIRKFNHKKIFFITYFWSYLLNLTLLSYNETDEFKLK